MKLPSQWTITVENIEGEGLKTEGVDHEIKTPDLEKLAPLADAGSLIFDSDLSAYPFFSNPEDTLAENITMACAIAGVLQKAVSLDHEGVIFHLQPGTDSDLLNAALEFTEKVGELPKPVEEQQRLRDQDGLEVYLSSVHSLDMTNLQATLEWLVELHRRIKAHTRFEGWALVAVFERHGYDHTATDITKLVEGAESIEDGWKKASEADKRRYLIHNALNMIKRMNGHAHPVILRMYDRLQKQEEV